MKRLAILFLCLVTWISSSASHIVGGGFQLTHIRANIYTLTFNMYVDAVHAMHGLIEGETSILVGIYTVGTNQEVARVTLGRISRKNLPTADTCRIEHLNTDLLVFKKDIELNPSIYNDPQGYYISYQRCCRQAIIENIKTPDTEGCAFIYQFPSPANGLNSSSTNPALKDIQALLGQNYSMDFSSTDPDGDSLSYKLVTPKAGLANLGSVSFVASGPYPDITWTTGYNLSTIIPGSPALYIDERTGMIQVAPSSSGHFIFAVETEEYRNGTKIASAIREYRIYVIDQSSMVCLGPEPDPNPSIPKNSLILSPNPSRYYLNINLNGIPGVITKIEIVNALGEFVTNIPVTSDYIANYNTGFLAPGMYVLIIHSSHTTKRERFVKE